MENRCNLVSYCKNHSETLELYDLQTVFSVYSGDLRHSLE